MKLTSKKSDRRFGQDNSFVLELKSAAGKSGGSCKEKNLSHIN